MIEDLVIPVRTGKKYKVQDLIIQHLIPETTWAYLAGFVDGEGSLNFDNSCDKDECCLFTDDGVCYDDECLIAEAKTILKEVKP